MVHEEVRDPFGPDDIGSPTGTGVAPKRLCIISRDPLRCGGFVAALKTALSSRDQLEIIVDRRRGGSATDQPSIERRHDPHCAHALERVGVAIVPTRAAQLAEPSIPAALPVERVDPQDADEHRLQRILEYRRQRKVRRSRGLILPGLTSVILVLLVPPAVKTLMSRAQPAASASADRMNASSTVAPVPPVAEPSSKPAPPVAETPSPKPEAPAVEPVPTGVGPPAPESVQTSARPTSSASAARKRPAARIRLTTPTVVAAPASVPPSAERQEGPWATQGQATALERRENNADDPRVVIDWLLNR